MPKLARPSTALVGAFDGALPGRPGVERRLMFGMPAGFVHGTMFAGLFEESVVVRLPPDGLEELRALGGEPFEPMGRRMREYLVLPTAIVGDRAELGRWLERACLYAESIPPRPKRPPRRRGSG